MAAMADSDNPNEVSKDFDAWANVSVRLQQRAEPDAARIVADLGLGEVWEQSDAHWGSVLAQDLLSGSMRRLARYGALCARELERRRSGAPAPAQLEITRPPDSSPTGPLPGAGDFRLQAMFGERPSRPRDSGQQIGGTPFSDDPLDHQPTSKMRAKDVREALARAQATQQGSPEPPPDAEVDRQSSPAFAERFTTGAIAIRPALDQSHTFTDELGDVRNQLVAVRAAANWTVEQWAHVQAELAERPQQRDAIMARYGLDRDTSQRSVEQTWLQRLEAHPDLQTRFEKAFSQGRARISAGSSRPSS